MPVSYAQAGPLSVAQLLSLWQAACDRGYTDPFIVAGEGNGLEVFTQAFAGLARVSQAIDTTMGSLYILPWSGQTAPPAPGGALATVTLTIQRGGLFQSPLILGAGLVLFGEVQTDWGLPEGVANATGRQYVLTQDAVFNPGDAGPLQVTAVAVAPGYGFNNPLPASITDIAQPGTRFTLAACNVTVSGPLPPTAPTPPPARATIITPNAADTFLPQHVGQYVQMTVGPNAGMIARIVGWAPPNLALTPPTGSTAVLEMSLSFESHTVTGAGFNEGDLVSILSGATIVGTGQVKGTSVLVTAGHTVRVTIDVFTLSPAYFASLTTLTISNLAIPATTATIDQIMYDVATVIAPDVPLPQIGATTYVVLDWVTDWQLEVTNVLSPAGGTLAVLDELGSERAIYRSPGEPDSAYRARVAQVADVVSPNAIKRAVSRSNGGQPFCFREVGQALLPGFFFDGDEESAAVDAGRFTPDAWDYGVTLIGGSLTSGAFVANERVQYVAASGSLKATGFWGPGPGTPYPQQPGATFTMIMTGINVLTTASFAAGDVVIGMTSGAIFTAANIVALTTPIQYRFHEWLDYTDFRAMFLVGIAPSDLGEFGFAWGALPAGSPNFSLSFFDAGPYPDFYDGFPLGAQQQALQIYQAVDVARAGGVGWYLYQELYGCS
jgi:hypothetical protein